ncbi:hypothetical protein F5Y12DRAFT_717265 [Xylaria sp. FL1777]|nr:hypothetical protein F5Y12DRAFT_717265 [Xylaria sp. FL1777]
MSTHQGSQPPSDGDDDGNIFEGSQSGSNPNSNNDGLFVNLGDHGQNDLESGSDDNLEAVPGNDTGDEQEDEHPEQEEVPGENDDNSDSDVNPEDMADESSDEEDRIPRRRPGRSKSGSEDCPNCEETRRQWSDEVTKIKRESDAKIRELNDINRKLRDENNRLKEGNRIVWDTLWVEELPDLVERIRLRDPNNEITDLLGEYSEIYHNSFKQGNMSTRVIHPDLLIEHTAYTPAQIREHFNEQVVHVHDNGALDDLIGNDPFPFEMLPIDIQYYIWEQLIPVNEFIHCLSRLDSQNPPLDYDAGRVSFPSRFHIGDGPCCIAMADKPSRYLDYLRVSKRWHYVLAHLFYATNTFAFSSIGELGRFCNGIGKARVERLVHIEFMWHGMVTPKLPSEISPRKVPLSWFMRTSRLRTLAIHINESGRDYMRRRREMKHESDYFEDFAGDEYDGHDGEDKLDLFGMEVRRTDLQPNYRKYRSMRTIHGMDYIYQLRGMKWVRFFDTNAKRSRTPIRDWSFLQDVNNTVKMKKSDSMILKTEIENLRPLTGLKEFTPDDETRELVASFYDDTSVEDVSAGGSETSSSSSSNSDSDSDDDSDDNPGDSSERHSSNNSGGCSFGASGDPIMVDSDSDSEMDDDRDGSGGLLHSGLDNRNESQATTITPQPPVIVIEDDDDSYDNGNRRSHTTDEELFVRLGSGSAHSNTPPPSDDDEVMIVRGPSTFIDLTLDDDDDNGTEPMDIDEQSNNTKEDDDYKEIKLEEDLDNLDEDDYENQSPSNASNPDSGSGSNMLLKHPKREGGSD